MLENLLEIREARIKMLGKSISNSIKWATIFGSIIRCLFHPCSGSSEQLKTIWEADQVSI